MKILHKAPKQPNLGERVRKEGRRESAKQSKVGQNEKKRAAFLAGDRHTHTQPNIHTHTQTKRYTYTSKQRDTHTHSRRFTHIRIDSWEPARHSRAC